MWLLLLSFPTAGDTFPEAEVDEVLDSLRQRIRTMFSWAKFDVAGFEDLSPLDQKALLRRTVAELVMLGFARASIAYTSESPPDTAFVMDEVEYDIVEQGVV